MGVFTVDIKVFPYNDNCYNVTIQVPDNEDKDSYVGNWVKKNLKHIYCWEYWYTKYEEVIVR